MLVDRGCLLNNCLVGLQFTKMEGKVKRFDWQTSFRFFRSGPNNWLDINWLNIAARVMLIFLTWVPITVEGKEPTVVVYGATPAGIAAALAAGEEGESVLLVEPTSSIGGLVTSGLSHTDIRTFESITGTFLDFTRRVEAHYQATYGNDSPQTRNCERGIFGEPSVNLLIFESMLAEQPRVEVIRQTRLVDVTKRDGRTIESVTLTDANGKRSVVSARLFIDASYEGDLMAAGGVQWRLGRESREEYGESLAPPEADDQLQAYNFRLVMTRIPENRVMPLAPAGYRREDFLAVLDVLSDGRIERIFGYPSKCLFKAHEPPLPNGKYDINDVSNGIVRLSLPGVNREWPSGDATTRERIFNEQLRDQVGLLYFIQNDDAVPREFREEARQWGWCRDEFQESGHLPPQLYVREARRMKGLYTFTEQDTDHAPDDARAVLHTDSIAMGDYGPNCHGTAHEGPRFAGRHTGEFYKPVVPYQIPYGVLVPIDVDNLLVAGAVSASHVGFCALRYEPIWTSLGQAAGHAAHLAIEQGCPAADVPVTLLQLRLHAHGSATTYVSDVPPAHADFTAVQWWGLHGGWHGLNPQPEKPGQRGRNLHGQYFAAFPNHASELDQELDAATWKRWSGIANHLELKVSGEPSSANRLTRGDFLRALWTQVTTDL